MIKALLLIAHGSRNKEANEDLVHLAKRLVSRELQIVEPSYLELAEPEIETGLFTSLRSNRFIQTLAKTS